MRIFLDTLDFNGVKRWINCGVVDGVTTNPLIARNEGVPDYLATAALFATTVNPIEVSIQVTSLDHSGMFAQAMDISSSGENVFVKIPVISSEGVENLSVIRQLAENGVRVNATSCMTFGQAFLAARAGAVIVSLFWGRMLDEGADPEAAARLLQVRLGEMEHPASVLAGSIRSVGDIMSAVGAGVDIVTVPLSILERWLDHKNSRFTAGELSNPLV
jgi:transaldolase